MKVLLLGATGNLGTRLIPSLLTHNHTIIAYVRSPAKLASLLPPSVHENLTIVVGDAKDSQAITAAILEHKCDAVINTSGLSAVMPWNTSDFPELFGKVVEGVREAGKERGRAVRFWGLGGVGAMRFPGTKVAITEHFPFFHEHIPNLALLRSLPPDAVNWSLLCPSYMAPESTDFSVPAKGPKDPFVGGADSPPQWNSYWFGRVPLVGRFLEAVVNAARYNVTLEQAAEFIARDLESRDGEWSGKAVGIRSCPR